MGSGGGVGQRGYYPSRRVEWLAPLSEHKRSGHSRTGERPHLKNGGHQLWLVPVGFTSKDVHTAKTFGLNNDIFLYPQKLIKGLLERSVEFL